MDETTEDQIVDKLIRIVGYVPPGTLDLLHILRHPDVIDLTKQYLEEVES